MKFLKKLNIKSFFKKNFSFDSGIDLNDDVEVLYRKNVVIKNIIFVTNIIYAFILMVITLGSTIKGVNWLWSVIPLPLTFVLNYTLKKIIENKDKNIVRQQIGMYICSSYLFLSAFLVYLKLKRTESTIDYAEAGYLLLYFSLIIITFYQDTKMLKFIYLWALAGMTVIHFTLTHNFASIESEGFIDFFKNVLPNNPYISYWFRDILFRTLVLTLFMLATYVITYIGKKMSEERKIELTKRNEIQDEYSDVVTTLYGVLIDTKIGYDENESQIPLVLAMSRRLGLLCGLDDDKINELLDYAAYNSNHKIDLEQVNNLTTEEKFTVLEGEADTCKIVAKRLQLSQKAENIVRAHLEGWANEKFKIKMLNLQNDINAQIILLSEVYINLRSVKSYKRPYSHKVVMSYFEQQFYIYFNEQLYSRFKSFENEFEEMFDKYEY